MTTSSEYEHMKGPMGSDFFRLRVEPKAVPALAKLDWNRLGKRVMIDPIEGIISWMSPSKTHEGGASASDRIVELAGNLLNIQTADHRGTRWEIPKDPKKIEPDASFYIGEKAERYLAIFWNDSKAAADRFAERTPPDLVVEIEVTHYDRNKPARYARLGVRELWQATYHEGQDAYQTSILDLRAKGGPREVSRSRVLPGLTTNGLAKAYMLAEGKKFTELSSLLQEDLIVPVPPANANPLPKPGM